MIREQLTNVIMFLCCVFKISKINLSPWRPSCNYVITSYKAAKFGIQEFPEPENACIEKNLCVQAHIL